MIHDFVMSYELWVTCYIVNCKVFIIINYYDYDYDIIVSSSS